MHGLLYFLASFAAGSLLGGVFFWGLWLTVSELERARRPAILMLASLLLRFTLVLGVFYGLARYVGWPEMIAAALGFSLARLPVMLRRGEPPPARGTSAA